MRLHSSKEPSEVQAELEALAREIIELKEIAPYEDPVTGVGNAARFKRELSRFAARFRRRTDGFSVVLIEVSPTSTIASDALGARLADVARLEDCVCKLGDGVFGVLLDGTAEAGAREFLERARYQIAAEPFHTAEGTIYASAIGGVVEWCDNPGALWPSLKRDIERYELEIARQADAFGRGG